MDIDAFIKSLSRVWKDGEARTMHRGPPGTKHWWQRKVDPSADAWPLVDGWLIAAPGAPAKVLTERWATMFPEAYAGNAQLQTLQRRAKAWRAERTRALIVEKLREPANASSRTAWQGAPWSNGSNVRFEQRFAAYRVP